MRYDVEIENGFNHLNYLGLEEEEAKEIIWEMLKIGASAVLTGTRE